jgi:SAM-dependent methyltransferase
MQAKTYSESSRLTLDLGCGPHKHPGSIGVDRVPLEGVDIVANFEQGRLPFKDDSFKFIYAHHILEHIRNLTELLAELQRICCSGANIEILVPYFTCVGAFGDPTHVRFFTYYTFDHFTDDPHRHTWFASTRFFIRSRHIGFGRLFRILGIEWFANRYPHIYENFLAYIFPARTLKVELTVQDILPINQKVS